MNFIANESAIKLRGAYYTDPAIAAFLARWAMEKRPKRVLEPGCGDGVFLGALEAAAEGSSGRISVTAFEIEPDEATKAAKRAKALTHCKTEVILRDYLDWSLKEGPSATKFGAVVGNPPFIRYQYLDNTAQENAERLFATAGLPFTRHTNAWVPFVIASISQLEAGGRLAMVVPSELLHVLHAQSLRDFLIASCSTVLVGDPQELWFDQALQGTVLLMAERRAPTDAAACRIGILPLSGKEFLTQPPARLFQTADFCDSTNVAGKWMSLMLSKQERDALDEVRSSRATRRFVDVADVDVGIVTGANKFFLVTDEVVEQFGLSRWAKPMFGRSEHARGLIYDDASHAENREQGLPTNFLDFGQANFEGLPAKVREYIRLGEAEQLHTRYKCRIRKPWYGVPSVWAAPIGMLKRSHDFPRLILNESAALTTDTAYRITPRPDVEPARLVFSFINSATMLSAELEGRHYGGGVLELVPSEIERLLIVLPEMDSNPLVKLDKEFRSGTSFDSILEKQDGVVLKAMGVSGAQRSRVFNAWSRLRSRRQRDNTQVETAAA